MIPHALDLRSRRPAMPVLLAAAVLLTTSCGSDAGPRWAGSVDTLPGGAVLVRNPADGAWDSASAWRLEEELRIGAAEGTGPEVFTRISALALDRMGRLYVLERSADAVKVFDGSGSHVRTIGRSGGGPGELDDPVGIALSPEGRLWIVDPGNARYSVFDTSGAFLTSYQRPIPGYSMPWPGTFRRDGVLYDLALLPGEDGLGREYRGFESAGEELRPVDTVSVPPDPFPVEDQQFDVRLGGATMSISIPWAPDVHAWLDPAGYLWFGRTDRYRIVQRTLDGDTVKIVERAWEPAPVTERDTEEHRILRTLRERGADVDESRIPETKPAYRSFRADESGRLWVAPYVSAGAKGPGDSGVRGGSGDDDSTVPLDLFDADGRYLGRIHSPVGLGRSALRADRLCGVRTDELGVQRVVCYRIVR